MTLVPVQETVYGVREALEQWRSAHPQGKVALVPTMGALHAGHLELIGAAARIADVVVVSIFVNPTQFAPGEDFESYPRTLQADLKALSTIAEVLLVFCPAKHEMYPPGDQTHVSVPALSTPLCGQSRPHFFGGVATVVIRLLNIVMADVAVFGEKDFQQLQVIRRMAIALHHRTEIVGVPTVREPDGLAMSSRNRYLSAQQRLNAAAIYQSLLNMQIAIDEGQLDCAPLVEQAKATISAAGGRIDYVQIVDPQNLQIKTSVDTACRVLAAAWFGEARLIDNLALSVR